MKKQSKIIVTRIYSQLKRYRRNRKLNCEIKIVKLTESTYQALSLEKQTKNTPLYTLYFLPIIALLHSTDVVWLYCFDDYAMKY